MNTVQILLRAHQALLVLPGVLVILLWKKLWPRFSLICYFLIIVSAESLISIILAELKVFNHWMLVPIVVTNTIVFALVFLTIIPGKVFNNLTWLGVGLVIMAIVAEFYFFGGANQFYPYGTTTQSAFGLVICLVYFYHFREDDTIVNPYRVLHFWFAASLIMQFGVTILVNIFSKAALVTWQETQDGSFIYALLNVRHMAIIIGQSFLIFGLWMHRSIPSRSFT